MMSAQTFFDLADEGADCEIIEVMMSESEAEAFRGFYSSPEQRRAAFKSVMAQLAAMNDEELAQWSANCLAAEERELQAA